jgi:hypothetical protein
MRYILRAALAVAASFMVSAASAERIYTEDELKCAVEALYYENGSSMRLKNFEERYEEYLRIIAHTLKVRAETLNPYLRSDWGGPDLCNVIRKRTGSTYQYSYLRHPHPVPLKEEPWSYLQQLLKGLPLPILIFPPTKPEPELPAEVILDESTGKVYEKDLWERAERAAYAVFREGWKPRGEMALADTYWHKCLLKDFRPEEPKRCGSLKLASGANLCWHSLEQVIIPGQQGIHRLQKHVFSRRVSLEEQAERLMLPPTEECENQPAEVEKIHSAWRYWLPKEYEARLNPAAFAEADAELLKKQQAERSEKREQPASKSRSKNAKKKKDGDKPKRKKRRRKDDDD